MPYESKALHQFRGSVILDYEFEIFTSANQIPMRQYFDPDRDQDFVISVDANRAQVDLPLDDDGNGVPVDNTVYTQINQYPYLLRNTFTMGGDAYQGGPGFIYTLGEFRVDSTARDATYASEREQALALNIDGIEAATVLESGASDANIMINATSIGNYPTRIGPHLKLSYNSSKMSDTAATALGAVVTDDLTKIHAFYNGCRNVATTVNTDCITFDGYYVDGDSVTHPERTDPRRRPISLFAPSGHAEFSGIGAIGDTQPFRHIVKSSTFIPTGLPPFDEYGFIDIKNHDFSHLQQDGAAGMINREVGYQDFGSVSDVTAGGEGVVLNSFIEEAFEYIHERKKFCPVYFWGQSVPSKKTKNAFKNYFMGNNSTFTYGFYDDPDLVSPDGSAFMNQADKSVHYRFDPSCVPYTAFRFHYDCVSPSSYTFSILAHDDYNYLLHPSVYKSDDFATVLSTPGLFSSYGRDGLVAKFATGGSGTGIHTTTHDFRYNLESAICGRIPPIFTLAAKYNSSEAMELTGRTNTALKMHAVAYDIASNSEPDGGHTNYTAFEKKLVGGNMYLKDKYPFPWDGQHRTGNYNTETSSPNFGTYGVYYPFDVTKPSSETEHWIKSYREWRERMEGYGNYSMKWSRSPGYHMYGGEHYDLAWNRYKNSLRVFFGTREGNVINSIVTLKKHVDKLAGAWTYDAEPKEARIRMQKRIPFKQNDFSTISEGSEENIFEGATTITLSDDAAMTSDTEVLPDDMGGTTGVY